MDQSILKKNWQQKEQDENFIEQIIQKYQKTDILARLLSSRISNVEDVVSFCCPKLEHSFPDPFKLKDMKKSVNRLLSAVSNSEKVCIFADYDVDGSTSCALLVKLFQVLQVKYDVYVPHRLKEGYGPSKKAIDNIVNRGTNLLITVDCGAVAYDVISYGKSLNLDIIVIDHHLSDKLVKDAFAVINPNRVDEQSNLTYLAAVGVVYLFVVAFVATIKLDCNLRDKVRNFNLLHLLDLVALGTVCDVVPLIGLNRVFVCQGIKVLVKRKNIGLKVMWDLMDIRDDITSYHLGFLFGPRINAASRMGYSNITNKLLSTNCENEAMMLALQLEECNKTRKQIELDILKDALKIVGENNDDVIIVDSSEWHVGVIGIIASRIKDLYEKPVFVISWENDIGKCSCRSIKGIDLGAKIIFAKLNGLLLDGGGHPMAGGCTIRREKLEDFKSFITNSVKEDIKNIGIQYFKYYDICISLNAVNKNLLDEIEVISPFGVGNPEPVFRIDNLRVLNPLLRAEKHVSCFLYSSSKKVKAIAFGAFFNDLGKFLLSNPKNVFSIICKLKSNFFLGEKSVQCVIEDILV